MAVPLFQGWIASAAGSVANPFVELLDRLVPSGRHHRRASVVNDRAHIEVRGVHRPGSEALARRVEDALEKVGSVDWAQVNSITGRVVVAFDPDSTELDDLVSVVESVEEAHGVAGEDFPLGRPEAPGDPEPLRRNLTALSADAAGCAIGLMARTLRLPALPGEVAAAVSFLDSQPRVRRALEGRLGHAPVDLALALASAATQALTQGPLGLVVDGCHRAGLIGEIRACQRAWERREPTLQGKPHAVPLRPAPVEPRATALPNGPIERYTDRASLGALGVFGVALAATRDPRRATNALLAGLPKAARLGREAFAAQLARTLADRDIVVWDRRALRRLDRVSTVVLDAPVLLTGRYLLGQMVVLPDAGAGTSGRARTVPGPAALSKRARAMFDPSHPTATRRRSGWALGPLRELGVEVSRSTLNQARRLASGRQPVLGLAYQGRLRAIFGTEPEVHPMAAPLLAEARAAGLDVVLAGTAPDLGACATVPGGRRTAASVRALQAEGRGVVLVSGSSHAGLRAADIGIGVAGGDERGPWGADVFCRRGLEDACLVVRAAATARQVSTTSALIALAGSAVGGTWAMLGPASSATGRALLPVNAAALAAQATGSWIGVAATRRPPPLPADQTPWHAMDADEVLSALGTSATSGLASGEAHRRPTAEAPVAGASFPRALLEELANPLTPMLGVGAGLSAAIGSLADAGLVGSVLAVNALLGAGQRVRAEGALGRLTRLAAPVVVALRDGLAAELPAGELVTGDVVLLGPGQVVPADCRVVEASSCEVDESSLTGESMPVKKSALPVPGAPVAERACMLYEGTTVVAGTARAVVVAVGAQTEAGRSLAGTEKAPPSGVEARLARITSLSVPVTVASGAVVAAMSLAKGCSNQEAVSSGVSLAVAAVPEGLPLLATTAQLAAARRLSQRGVLVRNPRAIEALGRVDVLCFDKTGTLTEGRIALRRVSDGHTDEALEALGPAHRAVLAAALRASPGGPSTASLTGLAHPTDRAVVEGAALAGVRATEGLGRWQPIDEVAFEPARGFHATIGDGPEGRLVSVKGAPEVVLGRCRRWRSPEGTVELDSRPRRLLQREIKRLAGQGLRVLAVAERTVPETAGIDDGGVADLDLVGFIALADSVRPTAAAAISSLRQAGIGVVMITGDHPATAEAIASELGMLNGTPVVTGTEIDAMDEDELARAVEVTTVFARATPAHKVRVVAALQRAGRVVAVTGDGANDAPAIRLAHAGIAVGRRCTAAAREAADVVVTDDAIETIIDAIIEGRAMWVSVRDALSILLGGNLGEVGFIVGASAVSAGSPLGARQLLLVNMLTDMLPATAIALRPPPSTTPDALAHEGPEASLGAALVRSIALRAFTTSAGAGAAWLAGRATGRARRASTMGLVALVGTQLGQTVATGGRSPLVVASSLASAGMLAAVVQTPGLSRFFGCTPLGPLAWAISVGAAGGATALSVVAPSATAWAARSVNNLCPSRHQPGRYDQHFQQ